MKIIVVGLGYVGLSNAVLLAKNNLVIAVDIDLEKVKMVNNRISPIVDFDIQHVFSCKDFNLHATSDTTNVYRDADYVLIATPTDYNEDKDYFDTSSVEQVIIDILKMNNSCTIIIRSTIPVGFTERMKIELNYEKIIFCPEFLREGKALHDNLFPSRIILGDYSIEAKQFSNLLVEAAEKKDIEVIFCKNAEAESIKLFSNTYLAMRVAYFNELDMYAELNNLDTRKIIQGVCADDRIGNYYNNPSFGYGGYCLPKDTKQLRANYKNIPNKLINAIVESNITRAEHIAHMITKKNPSVVGIYRLVMKSNSDNFRFSSIQNVIQELKKMNYKVVIYEQTISSSRYMGLEVIKNFTEFANVSDIIIANRIDDLLSNYKEKVYSRDLFSKD
ncbi:MAG: nucleotide sugar dehydrogenase [Anaerorhabdus sp.]|uniref:nucleotide sugar dehydrogenase n=1 Tax=Anaerorhabdus sp. TaxID=1872524 RepID=UPI002FC5829B